MTPRTKAWRAACTLWALVLLAGCASITAPQSFQQRLAYAYATNTSVRETAANLLDRGKLTVEQGQKILYLTDQVKVGLDLAKRDPNPEQATFYLDTASALLFEAQKVLEKEGKP